MMRDIRSKLTGRRGFTLAELLITISIVAILVAIGFAGGAEMQHNMKQAQLDRMAENLYNAAQNQLKLRAASGMKLTDKGWELAQIPTDMDAMENEYVQAHPLRYVMSSKTEAAQLIFPAGSLSEDVRSGSWIVEFEPLSYTVYSVFYSEGENLVALYGGGNGEKLSELRGTPKQRRLASDGTVGYYSGSIAQLASCKTGELGCKLEIENEEELKALVTVELPWGNTIGSTNWNAQDYAGATLTLTLKVTGRTSGAAKSIALSHGFSELNFAGEAPTGNVKKLKIGAPGEPGTLLSDNKLVFDSLKKNNGSSCRFGNLFTADDNDITKKFIPGEDILVEATVSCQKDGIVLYPASDHKTVNSLFANGSSSGTVKVGDKSYTPVYIKCGRHLQNLGKASGFMGIAGKTAAAMQIDDLAFGNNSLWQKTYDEKMKFVPLDDPQIAGYYGNNKEICELSTGNATGNAGIFASFSGSELQSVNLVRCTFAGSEAAGALVGEATGALTVSGCKTDNCTVAGGSAAGGLVGEASGSLTVSGCKTDNCTVAGGTVAGGSAAGGLVGEASGTVKIVNSCVFMSDASHSEGETARDMDWLKATGGAAGGLIGSVSGTLTVEKSFAATVVKSKTYAGGLAGSVSGALTVKSSYADCYLNAVNVGGLAGSCGSGSSFTNCYSAGFTMDGGGLEKVRYAAGFVPSAADVTNSYTVFCFDDATVASGNVPTPAAVDYIYALAKGGERTNAYHNCSVDTAKDVTGEHKSAAELEALKESDLGSEFSYSDADMMLTTLYRLHASGIILTEPYPYPLIPGLPHYNDFLATTPAEPVELWAVTLKGTADAPASEMETKPYGQSKYVKGAGSAGSGYVPAQFAKRRTSRLAFVGWFDEKTLFDGTGDARTLKTGMLKDWYAQLDELNISSGRLENVPEDLGALPYESGKVSAKDSVWETKRLYAVYREVLPFDVTIKFINYDVNLFKGDNFTDQQIRQQYLDGSSVSQDIYYTVDPLQYDEFYRSGPKAEEQKRTFTINTAKLDLDQKGYAIIDDSYALRNTYLLKDYPSASYPDLDKMYLRLASFVFDNQEPQLEKGAKSAVYTNNGSYVTLEVKTDRKRVCSLLCSSALFEVPLRFAFLDTQANTFADAMNNPNPLRSSDYPKTKTVGNSEKKYADFSEEAAEDVKGRTYVAPTEEENVPDDAKKTLDAGKAWFSSDGSYCLRKEDGKVIRHAVYTVVVNMKLPPNMVVWNQIPEFDGFKLLSNEIRNQKILKENLVNNVYPLEKAPLIPFERTYFTLAFDLDGGVHWTGDKKYNMIDSVRTMRYRQDTTPLLPVSAERKNANAASAQSCGWVDRPGYVLTGWDFYDLKTYSAKSEEPLGRIELYDNVGEKAGTIKSVTLYEYEKDADGNTVKDVDGKPVVKETTTSAAYLMPACDVMAKAHWNPPKYAPVRVEIYVQNVTDDWTLNRGDVNETTYEQDATYSMNTAERTYGFYNAYSVGTKENPVAVDTYKDKTDPATLLALAYTNGGKRTDISINGSDVREYLSVANGTVNNKQLIFNKEKTFRDGVIPYDYDAFGNAVFRVYYDRALITFEFDMGTGTVAVAPSTIHGSDNLSAFKMYEVSLDSDGYFHYYRYYNNYYVWLNNSNKFAKTGDSEVIKLGSKYYIFANRGDWGLTTDGDYYYEFTSYYSENNVNDALAFGYEWTYPSGLIKTDNKKLLGLYEQAFDENAKTDEEREARKWPGEGYYYWYAYPKIEGVQASEQFAGYKLSYMSSFFYDDWIGHKKESYRGTHELIFDGTKDTSTNAAICFFIEKDGARASGELKPDAFMPNAKFVWHTAGNMSFTLSDKFDGYTVYGYRTSNDENVGITTNVRDSDGTYQATGYSTLLNVYYTRNEYRVYFKDARFGSADHLEDKYYYGETVDRLPELTAAGNAPGSIGDAGYDFVGWYTASNGKGNQLVICKQNPDGTYGPTTEKTKKEDGVTWKMAEGDGGVVCECIKKPGSVEYKPYRISSANRVAFAYWAKKDASIRIFYRFPGSPDPKAADQTLTAHLFETIAELDPASENAIEKAWVTETGGKYDIGTKTYTLRDGVKYYFDGWYQYFKEDDCPKTKDVLGFRFHEREYVTQDTMTLAAQWTQKAGKADYKIVCNMLDEYGAIVKTLEINMSAAASTCRVLDKNGKPVEVLDENGKQVLDENGKPVEKKIPLAAVGSATIGEPLNVNAPTTTDYPELANELSGYYALTALQSIERFREGDKVVFFFSPADCWYYKTVYWADFDGAKVEIYNDLDNYGNPTGKTYAENVYVIASDPYQCYMLDASATNPIQLWKPADFASTTDEQRRENPVSAEFAYKLKPSAITSTAALKWVQGSAAPQLLQIGGVKGDTLHCKPTGGYSFETTYCVDSGEPTADLKALLDGLPLGTKTVTTTIVLKKDGVAVKTVCTRTTAVTVCAKVTFDTFGTLYYDGNAFSGDKTLEAIITEAADAAKPDGKTFKGFTLGDKLVIDETGNIIVKPTGEVTLTPVYEP